MRPHVIGWRHLGQATLPLVTESPPMYDGEEGMKKEEEDVKGKMKEEPEYEADLLNRLSTTPVPVTEEPVPEPSDDEGVSLTINRGQMVH